MQRSIRVPGLTHGANPIPSASVVGNILMSGAIFGMDPQTGALAPTADEQCALMFEHAGAILAAAGTTFEDVVKMTFHLDPTVEREVINRHWIRVFPDADARPARHVVPAPHLPASMLLQCDLIAVIGS